MELKVSPAAYAPLPATVVKTRLFIGSWFGRHDAVRKAVAAVALIAGTAYIVWRLIFTMPHADGFFFWPLFIGELFGYLTFLVLVVEAWDIPATPRLAPLDVVVDIVITTYNEDLDVVLPTVIGAKKIRGLTTIWLCDDGRRPEMKKLAQEYGINYQTRPNNLHAKAGNINAVLPKLKGELILVLDADHVPAPDFLEATSGYFADRKIALVQTAHSFRNHNSVMHEEEGRHEQSLFFDVLLPGRNRLNSVFWCGSAGLIRRAALVEVGGMATSTSTEDFETSLALQLAGHQIKYHNEHLVQGLAPDNLQAYVVQRFRWAQGTLGSYRKGGRKAWDRRLALGQRFSYAGGLLYHLTPIQRICYSLSLLSVTLFAVRPVGDFGQYFIPFWGIWTTLSMLAVTALERGVSQPFEGVRNHMITMEVFLRALPSLFTKGELPFMVTPKNEVDKGGWQAVKLLRLPILVAALSLAAIVVRWLSILHAYVFGHGFLPTTSVNGIIVASVFGATEAGLVYFLAARVFRRKQLHKLWRFPVSLDATADGVRAKVINLHHAGASILMPAKFMADKDLTFGSKQCLEIECRTVAGEKKIVRATLTVSKVSFFTASGNTVQIGGGIELSDHESMESLVEQCYIVEPYAARNRAWATHAPSVPVALEASVAGQVGQCVELGVDRAAFKVPVLPENLGDVLPISVTLDNGRRVEGNFSIETFRTKNPTTHRLNGVVNWSETSWLPSYTTMALRPGASVANILRAG